MGAVDKTRPRLLCRSHKTPEPDQITTKSRLSCVARTYKRFLNSPVYIWGLGVILRSGCYSEGLAGCISSRLAGVITRRVEFRMVSCCRHIFRHTHKEQTLYQTAAIVIRAEPQRCDSDSQTCVWTFAAISCVSHVWHTHTWKEGHTETDHLIMILSSFIKPHTRLWCELLHPEVCTGLKTPWISRRWKTIPLRLQ